MSAAFLQFAGLTALLAGTLGAVRADDVLGRAAGRLAAVLGVALVLTGISLA